jgi:hypothetical protein
MARGRSRASPRQRFVSVADRLRCRELPVVAAHQISALQASPSPPYHAPDSPPHRCPPAIAAHPHPLLGLGSAPREASTSITGSWRSLAGGASECAAFGFRVPWRTTVRHLPGARPARRVAAHGGEASPHRTAVCHPCNGPLPHLRAIHPMDGMPGCAAADCPANPDFASPTAPAGRSGADGDPLATGWFSSRRTPQDGLPAADAAEPQPSKSANARTSILSRGATCGWRRGSSNALCGATPTFPGGAESKFLKSQASSVPISEA